jgi:hypothetical protein
VSITGFARELLRTHAADILAIGMRGTGHTWLQHAIAAIAWLLALCAAGACTGPGLEPPASNLGGDRGDAGNAGAGGAAASGGTGGVGEPVIPGDAGSGDGDVDGASDAGEAVPDSGVDDDGGTDPDELEP